MKSIKKYRRMATVVTSASMLILSACGKEASQSQISNQNVRSNQTQVDSMIEGYRVARNDLVLSKIDGQSLLGVANGDASKFLKASMPLGSSLRYNGTLESSATAQAVAQAPAAQNSLILGMPIGILGEERALGGVITEVSNHEDENLGNLKLTDFPMIHGRLLLAGLDGPNPQVVLVGCINKCKETSPRIPLVGFPIVAVDAAKDLLMIDLSAVGRDLDLISIMDPDGEGTGLKSVSTVAKSFDSTLQTIVFDVESKLTAVDPVNNPVPDTNLTVRWYLQSASAFDPSFEARPATAGVGFFMTSNAADPKIKRFSMARYGDSGVKYYLKNVPAEWQPAFAAAFDEWNDTFQELLGRKLLDYEFVDAADPRYALLVTGDVRYNIVEWDLTNKATYGGLGPSIGNEYSGENLSANVLIQGPTVIELYSDWFKVGKQVQALQAQNRTQEADALLLEFSRAADARATKQATHSLKLGSHAFRIHSELDSLEDPRAQRNDFDELPPNVDFKTYMNGYFHDMLAHELGHNLGLRHNFRGNLGATDTGLPHSTSRSIMEYLGRRYRYLDGIGAYDKMAISYGYGNVKPTHFDWFCTDESNFNPKSPKSSPECTSDDATSDPFTFFEFRLAKAIDYLTARGQSYAPVWTQADMERELGIALKGLAGYALVNPLNATLTNFYAKGARPADSKTIREYVVGRVKQQLCDPNLELVVAGKYDPAAQKLTRDQINGLREKTLVYFKDLGVNLGFDVSCNSTAPASVLANQ